MKFKTRFIALLAAIVAMQCTKQDPNITREVITLKKGWKFNKGQHPNAKNIEFDDSEWEAVSVPHDWAIYGPFDKEN